MTTEAKTEAKQGAKIEAKEVAIEENTEPPLKYKRWVLKVSVHCEGCRRKVTRILKNIDGVYTIDVDLRQQKATIIGNVDADTLIKQLIKKTGKHAELWPEKADNNQKEKKKAKAKNKEKEKKSDQESSDEEDDDGDDEKEAVRFQDPSLKNCSQGGHGGAVQFKEVKINEVNAKQPVASPGGGQPPGADKKAGGESEVGAENSGGKKKKKKKKKKAHQGNNNNGDEGKHSGQAPAGTGSPSLGHVQVLLPHPANHSPPRHHPVYDCPATTYYAPPAHAVCSNVAYPCASYGAAYYPPQYSYAYIHSGKHPGMMSESPPCDLDSYPSHPCNSFEIFSDENPNACSIM